MLSSQGINKAIYLDEVNNIDFSKVENLIIYAKNNHVPIIKNEGLGFLLQLIRLKKAKSILEIGTAIGYSSIMMALNSKAKIITLEKDENMVIEAKKNISNLNLEKKIKVFKTDALEFNTTKKFDVIFIDAAKTKYIEYFNKYKKNIKKNGIIVVDNLLFHDLLFDENITKNQKRIITKIDKFNHYLKELNTFDSYIFQIGDGMSLSIRKV